MKKDVIQKKEQEKMMVQKMIRIYCRKNHQTKEGFCPECEELRDYAFERTERCPFMHEKTFCSSCKVHCYRSEMRKKIAQVMRFSGPRLLFTNPIWAISHMIDTMKSKIQQKKMSKSNQERKER